MTKIAFLHLDVHTEYSLGDSIVRVKELAEAAKSMLMPAVAITDQSNLYGGIKFIRACTDNGVKPLLGVDVEVKEENGIPQGRLILLCRNNSGYRHVCELLTNAYTHDANSTKVAIGFSELSKGCGDLIAISPSIDGAIGKLIRSGKSDQAKTIADKYSQMFPEAFYLEITRTNRRGEGEHESQILQLASEQRIPLVAGNAVRFLNHDDFTGHDIRVCIHEGNVLQDPRRVRRYTDQQYFKDQLEMTALFDDVPSALKNTLEIAKRCNVFLEMGKTHMPTYPTVTHKSEDEILKEAIDTGLKHRFEQHAIKETDHGHYKKRLHTELETIVQMGFSGYFLIVADFVEWAKEHDIPVGPGRGSGAGSLAAYSLGITSLDPIRYGLLFERFLNPERVSLPDFDIDFCMYGRDRVIEYVSQKYGRDRVAQIITYNTLAARAVVRDVGRVMSQPYGFCDTLAKMIPFEVGMTLDKALDQDEGLKERYTKDPDVTQLIDNARLLEGIPRNAGKHAGGLVIAPGPITHYTPLYQEPGMSQPVTQFDKDDLEAIGLVKFDFLGLRTLTVIDRAVKNINRKRSEVGLELIDIEQLALDDQKVYSLICTGYTTGLFQLESRGMQELIQRLRPDHFDELIALVALFRPGPLQSGMVDDFISRKHGHEEVRYPHPTLVEILMPTYGVILYQEQVMEIARVLSGYTLGSADLLRRAMGKKKPAEMREQRQSFVDGATERHVDRENATYIFDLIEKFAGYGFNKSHSAAYALLSYQTAWLKTHYPSEFLAACMSADMEHTDKLVVLVSEAKRMGISLLTPDINQSNHEFKVDEDGSIRYGLGAIKGLGERAIESLLGERLTQGEFSDLHALCRRVDQHRVNKKVFEGLIMSGSLDCLGSTRATLWAKLPRTIELVYQMAEDRSSGQNDMFGLESSAVNGDLAVSVPDWSPRKALENERQALGLYLSGHPIDHVHDELDTLITGSISETPPTPERRIYLAGLGSALRIFSNKRGETAAFFSLHDGSAYADVAVSSDLFQHVRNIIETSEILLVEGLCSLDDRTGQLRLKAEQIKTLRQIREVGLTRLVVLPDIMGNIESQIVDLQAVLDNFRPGPTTICVEYCNTKGDKAAINLGSDWTVQVDEEMIEQLIAIFGSGSLRYTYDKSRFRDPLDLVSSRAA
jgi:DNA polymerase-3 subunit alpha